MKKKSTHQHRLVCGVLTQVWVCMWAVMGGLWHQMCHWQPESPHWKPIKGNTFWPCPPLQLNASSFFCHSSDTFINVCLSVCALLSFVVRISCECCWLPFPTRRGMSAPVNNTCTVFFVNNQQYAKMHKKEKNRFGLYWSIGTPVSQHKLWFIEGFSLTLAWYFSLSADVIYSQFCC